MYIDYSEWETYDYSLNTLQLDLNNPRIKHQDVNLNQTDIVKFLITHYKVYELAKKISEEGYFVGEEPIICIEDNKKVVLEGNRRTAALKVLKDPEKYLPKIKAKVLIKNIKKNNYPVNRKLRCYIAPNRLLANAIIYERHRGSSLERWKTGNQYAFIAEMSEDGLTIDNICHLLNAKHSEIIEPIKAYNLFSEANHLLVEEKKEKIGILDFDLTNLERFYKYKDAEDFLGISFDSKNGDLIIRLPREEFSKRLIYMFQYIHDHPRFSRKFDKVTDKENFINDLRKNSEFDFSIKLDNYDVRSNSQNRTKDLNEEKSKITKRRRKNTKTEQYIISKDKEIDFSNDKLNSLFDELKLLPKYRVNSFAIVLRTLLEQSLYFYLKNKNLLDNLTEKENENNLKNGYKKVNTLISHLKGTYSFNKDIDTEPIMKILKFNIDKDYSSASLKIMLDYVKNTQLDELEDVNQKKNLKQYINNVKNELDLAVHNLDTKIDIMHNERAWNTLEPLFDLVSSKLEKEVK